MRLIVSAYPSRDAALAASRGAVKRRLAACASVVGAESQYWWRGRIERAAESIVLFKTLPQRVGRLFGYLKATHPYEVPEIVELDVPRVEPGFLRYLVTTLADTSRISPARSRLMRRGAPRAPAARGPRRTRAQPHRRSR